MVPNVYCLFRGRIFEITLSRATITKEKYKLYWTYNFLERICRTKAP